MATPVLRTYEPFADVFRGDPFFDVARLFEPARMRRPYAAMPEVPDIRMDVTETPEAYLVKAELPGMKKEDIRIVVEGNAVSISAKVERKRELKEGEKLVCTELTEGEMSRAFTLACDLDEAKAEAKYENGMLELKLPKKVGVRSKALEIA